MERLGWHTVVGDKGKGPTFQGIVLDKFSKQTWARMTDVKDKSQEGAANSFAFSSLPPSLPSSLPPFIIELLDAEQDPRDKTIKRVKHP